MTDAPPPPAAAFQPQPPLSPQDQRLWATLIHLGGILFGFIPALIGYLVLKDRGEFILQHTRTALNFQISLLIYSVAILLIGIITLGIGLFLIFPFLVVAIVFMIIAAVKANQGELYAYPVTIAFIK